MAVTIQLMFSNPVEGKEDEYNEWYDNVHVPELLAMPGMRSAQRFAVREAGANHSTAPGPVQRYLLVYEIEGDVEAVMGRIGAAAQAGELHMSDSLDLQSMNMSFWSPVGPKVESGAA